MSTSAVDVSIHATSPLFGVGAGAAVAAGAAAAAAAGAAPAAGLSCANVGAQRPATLSRARMAKSFFIVFSSESLRAGLAGADSDDLFEIEDEDLSVPDLAGVGGFLDRLDGLLEQRVLDRRLDLHLGQEIDHVFGSAIELGVALLPSEALDLGDRDALHADRGQGLAHLVKLERLDDCGD